MSEGQYRKLGTGEVAEYKRVFDFSHIIPFLKWWRKMHVLDYRAYKTQKEINDCVIKMQRLYIQLDVEMSEVERAKDKITNDRQDNPFWSAPETKSFPKDCKKFRKRRAKPLDLWSSVRNIVIKAVPLDDLYYNEASSHDASPEPELTASIDQHLGRPIRDNQQGKKKGNQQDHQQHHQH
jgi:hypothetical protein